MHLKYTASVMKFLCVGCGACIAVCPTNAILPTIDRGYFSIDVDENKCVNCCLCIKGCPMISYLFGKYVFKLPTQHARKTFLAWATDEKIRYRGASGGVITALLKYLLEKKVVDGALVVRMRGTQPEAYIARSVNDVLEAQGSIYFSTYSLKLVKFIAKTRERYTIVGLPCQISSVNILVKMGVLKEDNIAYLFALKCHSIFAHWYLNYILSLLKLRREDITAISSRSFGWPGKIIILSRRGIFQIPLMNRGLSLWNSLASTNLAAQFGCNICVNHEGFGADIVFGDAWIPTIIKMNNKGTSLINVFSQRGLDLIKEAVMAGVIRAQEIPAKNLQPFIPVENLAQKAIKTYIKKGIVDVLKTCGAKGTIPVFASLLFYNQYTRSLLLKLPYKVLMGVIDKGRLLVKAKS